LSAYQVHLPANSYIRFSERFLFQSTHPEVEFFLIPLAFRVHSLHKNPRMGLQTIAMTGPNFSPIEAVQRTKEMKGKIFGTFSHTPKRLPNRFHFWFYQRKARVFCNSRPKNLKIFEAIEKTYICLSMSAKSNRGRRHKIMARDHRRGHTGGKIVQPHHPTPSVLR
jgi:hypothetical protein